MKYLVLIFVTLTLSLTSYALPRPGASATKVKLKKTAQDIDGQLAESGLATLAPEVNGARILALIEGGVLAKATVEKLISYDLTQGDSDTQNVVAGIIKANDSIAQSSIGTRSGVTQSAGEMNGAIDRMTQIGIEMLQGKTGVQSISKAKMAQVLDKIAEMKGLPEETIAPAIAAILNDGLPTDAWVIPKGQEHTVFDVIKKCK
ncbi:MAG: hypothetical protein AAF203_02730 [Pseudomonadota bacterium]